jgi:tripartite-type tricarboxylate transporter receptor subunit TctC
MVSSCGPHDVLPMVLAVSASTRSPALPDALTLAELGAPEATGMNWFGFCTPAGLPAPTTERWVGELRTAFALPSITERIAGLGMGGTNILPSAMMELVGREVDRWREGIPANNVTAG